MIVGLGGGGLGVSRPQVHPLRQLLRRLRVEVAVHRGMTGMESMIHNIIRSVYPTIPVHVVPVAGVYSSIASQPLKNFPQTIIYEADSQDVVCDAILRTVWGVIFLPDRAVEGGPGWELPYEARTRGIPIVFIWPNGKTTLEGVEI